MRHLELFIGLSAIPFMILWWILPESPRWLLSKGRNEEAIKNLSLVCRTNKKPIPDFEPLLDVYKNKTNIKRGTMKGKTFSTIGNVFLNN